MSIITYVAIRNIEKTGHYFVATDISVSNVDNSLNSTSTDLSGLLADEWIYVEGFSNGVNNGWLQLDSNSTTNKIIITSDFTLVTETAGNQILITGHKRGYQQEYQLEFLNQKLTPDLVPDSSSSVSWGGVERSILKRLDYIYKLSLMPETNVNPNYYNQWLEFISSVSARELFVFDENGTIAVPATDKICLMRGKASLSRIGINDFILSFTMVIKNAF